MSSYVDNGKKERKKKKKYDSDSWYDESNTYYDRYKKVQESRAKELADQTAATLLGAETTSRMMNANERISRGYNGTYTDPIGRYIQDRTLGAMNQNVRKAGNKAVSDIDDSYAKQSDKDSIFEQALKIVNAQGNAAQNIMNNRRKSNEFMNQFDSKKAYEDAFKRAEYMSKYGGKTYEELKKIQEDNESRRAAGEDVSEEDEWIKDYADSVRTAEDVDREREQIVKEKEDAYRNHAYRKMTSRESPVKDYDKILEELDREKEKIMSRDYYNSIPEMEDFEDVSSRGAYREDNKVTHAKPAYDALYSFMGPALKRIVDKGGSRDGNYMSNDEKNIYSYILEKDGIEQAEDYRKSLQDNINRRKAGIKYRALEGNTGMELLSSIESGYDRFVSGAESAINNLFGDEALPVSESEYLSGMVREDLGNAGPKILGSSVGQMIYDIGENGANMAPSMAISMIPGVPAVAGAATLGVTSGASSANAAWRDGADRGDALLYGTVNGTLEGGLQYLLGGISAFGGKATGITKEIVGSKVNSALGKALVNTGISALGEGTEEYLQEIIDPVVKNLTLGEDNKFTFISDEALYAGMLGAVSGGLFESVSNVSQARMEASYQEIGKGLDADKIESLVSYAEKTDALKDAVESYKNDPSDINAGILKVETDRHIGEMVNEFVRFEDAETDFSEMDEYTSGIASEALEEAEAIMSQSQSDGKLLSEAIDSFSESALEVMDSTLSSAVVDPVTYKNAFANYYQYGRAGMSFDTAEGNATYRNELTDAQKRLAYETGKNDRDTYFESAQEGVSGKTNSASGILRYINESETAEGINVPAKVKDLDSRQKSSIMVLRMFAEVSGQNIALYSSEAVNGKVTAPNGWYDKSSDTIYIDVNSGDIGENAMLRTASHEITHTFKEWSPEKYKALQDYVIGKFEADGSIDTMIQEEIKLAKANGRNITYAEAMDEVTANACESMLKDTEAIERIADESPDIFHKIKLVISKIVADIKRAFEGMRSGSIEHKRMSEILEDWSGIQKLWDDAAVESAGNARAAQENADTGKVEDNIQYSIRSDFFKEYDKWNGVDPRVKFNLGTTSNALKEIGVKEADIIFDSSKIIDIKSKHPEMTDNVIKKIPELLEHPIIIMESRTVPGRIVLYGDISSDKGPVMAALELHPTSRGVAIDNMIKVASAYTKNNAKNQILNSDILWVYNNKNKTNDWLRRTRLQLPVGINQYGLIKTISSAGQQVNNNISPDKGKSQDVNRDFSYRGDTRSNREILADALMSATKNASERKSLESYQRVIGALDMQERLRREKVKLRNNAETAAERDRYQKDIDAIDKKIAYNDKRLIQMEAAAPIREVIKREVKANTEHDIDYIKKRNEEQRKRKQMTVLRNNIKNNSGSIISMLKKPTNQRHVPEGIKEPVTRFLASIDFISQQADPGSFNTRVWQDNMNSLNNILEHSNKVKSGDGDVTAYKIEFDPDLIERMKEFTRDNDGKKLSSMGMKEIEDLYIIVRSLRMGISNANKMFANKRSADAQKIGYNTVQELSVKKKKEDHMRVVSELDKLLNTDMLDASSYFKMLGDSAVSVYNGLYDGWKVRTSDIKEAGEYVSGIYESMDVKQKEINEWTGPQAKIHEFDIGGNKIELTTAQVMSLYEHGKREHSKSHIFGEGIISDVINRRFKSKNKSGKVKLSEADFNRITSVLTERQKQFADSMQRYLAAECAKKGNETSMNMYGYRKFTDENYFPIKVDGNSTQSGGKPSDINVGVRSIINSGMTKNITPDAKNAVIIRDIFDVFTDHVVDMANYHGLAAPLTDALKWYNYKYETGDGSSSVQEQIERVYGKEYKDYFINLLLDINGDTNRKTANSIPEKFVSAYKAAAVGANIRVVVQQPTAYIRAAALVDPKYLVKALAQKSAYKEAIDNSAIAWWKAQGYYDTGLGQSLKSLVTGQGTFRDNVVEKSMWLAGKADELTWGKLWNAVKLEVADNNKALDTSSEAYMKKVTERFEQIIDETQVVDTVFSKSQIMRNKDGMTKNLTAFMAEPIKSYNMLRNAVMTKNPKTIAGAASIFLVNSVATSAVSAVMDAMRALYDDKEKEKEFLERYEENFVKNLKDNSNPLNMIPYLRTLMDAFSFTPAGGSVSNRPEVAWMDTLMKSCKEVMKCFDGTSTKPPMYVVKQCAKAASQISGIPAYNFTRDLESVYNTVKYDVFGEKPFSEVAREAAEARLSGDMKTYSSLVYKLKDEGYEVDDIVKKVNSNMVKIKKQQKEQEESGGQDDGADAKEEKEQSIYKVSDVSTLLSSNDVSGANKVLDDLYNTELANADKGVKDYKYDIYKKLRQKVRAQLTKKYKSIDNAAEREKYGNILKQLTISKLYIYNDKDIKSLEKAVAREAKEKQKNNL